VVDGGESVSVVLGGGVGAGGRAKHRIDYVPYIPEAGHGLGGVRRGSIWLRYTDCGCIFGGQVGDERVHICHETVKSP